jgi:hypothetical protein
MIVKRGNAEILGVIPDSEVKETDELKAKLAKAELEAKKEEQNKTEK